MAYKHGVYVAETATSPYASAEGTSALQVVFGTAPIYMADDVSEATTPKLCESYSNAVEALGYCEDFEKFTICQSVAANFSMFGISPVVFVNVLDPATHVKAKVSAAEITVANGEAKVNVPYIFKSTLEVNTAESDGDALVQGTDFTVAYDQDAKLIIKMVSDTAKALASVYVTYQAAAPDAVSASDVVAAIAKVREVYPRFGMTPGLLLAPGWSEKKTVSDALQAACIGINGVYSAECVIDVDSSNSGATEYDDVASAKEAQVLASAHAIAVWPRFKSGSDVYAASAVIAALIAYTDNQDGDVPASSPSNKALRAITGLCLADGTEVILDQAQGNVVNAAGVMTAINVGGFRSWGNNTCAYPGSTDPKDRWIKVRRFFTWRSNALIQNYFTRVDDPANYRLIEAIVDAENVAGNSFVSRGICAGYAASFDAAANPVAKILSGEITFQIDMAPFTPAENIEFVLSFDPTAIEAALGGE